MKLVKDSTKEFWQEGKRIPGYTFIDWLHGYVYTRWPYFYIGTLLGERPIAKVLAPLLGWLDRLIIKRLQKESGGGHKEKITFADTYHGKVVPLDAARQLVSIDEEISLTNLESIIPYSRAQDIIMKNPDNIAVLDCPCRMSRENPCLPLDVCLIIGDPFAGFVLEHHPSRSRKITAQEAVEILEAENRRGHVHHAFFKDAMLNRFYAICNCCSCCCGAMQAQRNGIPMLASSGFLAVIDPDLCTNCGLCRQHCQFEALSVSEAQVTVVDESRCMGCGICVNQCASQAIQLTLAPHKGTPLEVNALMQQNAN